MPRYKLIIEYNGAPYAGWQRQSDRPSVQQEIEKAIAKFCGTETEVIGAGRTDAGVHAKAQVAHVDLPREYDAYKVMQGINFYLFGGDEEEALPTQNRIAILNAQPVTDAFHARFSATRRYYEYRIINRRARLGLDAGRAWHVVEPLDETIMQEAANILVGHHDFTSFRDAQCQAKSPVKTLECLNVARRGEDIIVLTHGRSFLHHQVRIMVGTLAMAGKGRCTVNDIKTILAAKDRSKAGPTAPPDGLTLIQVDY